MRFQLRPDHPLEWLALWLNLGPRAPAEAFFGMAVSRVVMAGVRLGVFAALAREGLTTLQVAGRARMTLEGAQHLLDALEALGHVRRRGGCYALAPRARRWLDPASDRYMGHFIEFNYEQWAWWSQLESRLQSSQSLDLHGLAADDERWRLYITAMFELARLAGKEVTAHLKLAPRASRLLDLGGGHGWYGAELCRRYPSLHARVLDLPGSARVGRQLLEAAGASERVTHQEGDFLEAPFEPEQDAILAFQILHHLSGSQREALLHKIHGALSPRGTLAVMDFLSHPRRPEVVPALLGLHYHLTSGSGVLSLEALTDLAARTGFRLRKTIRLRRLPIQSLCLFERLPAA